MITAKEAIKVSVDSFEHVVEQTRTTIHAAILNSAKQGRRNAVVFIPSVCLSTICDELTVNEFGFGVAKQRNCEEVEKDVWKTSISW